MGRLSVVATLLISLFALVQGYTNEEDVYALNQLYVALNSPFLSGWMASGGDPCLASWQGVGCAGPNVTLLTLSGLSLTGGLGSALENFTALIALDLSSNVLTGGLPLQIPPHLQQLNISGNLLSGNIPDIFQQSGTLTTLDLSNNDFAGSLPPSFGNLMGLNSLYLQNNQLSGTIDILAKLPLQTLDIANNSFTGWIPSELRHIPSLQSAGNLFNTFPAPPPPPLFQPPPTYGSTPQFFTKDPRVSKQTNEPDKYFTVGRLIGIAAAAFLTVAVAVLLVLFFVWKNHDREGDEKHDLEASCQGLLVPGVDQKKNPEPIKAKTSPEVAIVKAPPRESHRMGKRKDSSAVVLTKEVKCSLIAYTIAELQIASHSFSPESLVGDTTLGKVYKAALPSGKLLMVKILDYPITSVLCGDFVEFLSTISTIHHENISELVGYCVEHGEHLLVYEFVGNVTLHENLHTEVEKHEILLWEARMKIALGVSRALEYLHEGCVPAIVHRNVTTINILLDSGFNPHLCDCGFAALFSLQEQHQASTEHLVFSGYSAPEHMMSGTYTIKSDVYSFGVVMLELLTGRKPLDSSRPRSEQSLVRWAVPQLHDIDALAKMVDPNLKGSYPVKSIYRFANVISQCVQPDPEFRPPMSEVTQSLIHLLQGNLSN